MRPLVQLCFCWPEVAGEHSYAESEIFTSQTFMSGRGSHRGMKKRELRAISKTYIIENRCFTVGCRDSPFTWQRLQHQCSRQNRIDVIVFFLVFCC